jgi:D-3-phosphoglycerate dehydrogenase / 2-oxoglutarate reductase
MKRIVVLATDGIAEQGLACLRDDERFELVLEADSSSPAFDAALASARGLLVRSATRVDADLLARAPALEVVGRAGVGVDNIDIQAATRRGVAVLNAPAGNTVSAAELTMALILATLRRVPAADRSIREGVWARGRFKGAELRGRTLGLVGGGRIGGEVARRARAFEMRVLVHDPYLPEDRVRGLDAEPVELDALLAASHVVSLHVPLTEATRGLLDARRLARMPRGSYLINASRGGIVDEDALARALTDEHLAGAALDVFAVEPLAENSPLRSAPNLILTPHLGASTEEAQARVAEEIAEGVRDALAEGDLSRALNAPAVAPETLRRMGSLLDLGRRLGRVAAALARGPVRAVEIGCDGDDEALRIVPRHVLMGLLESVIGREGVNVVNAAVLAQARGMTVSTRRLPGHRDYGEVVEVSLETEGGPLRLAGALLGERHPRLVRLDGYDVNVAPAGTFLVLRNRDVPGVIGRVGTLLGGLGLNIAEYHQARQREGGEALAAVVLDGPLDRDAVARLGELPEVLDARLVVLDP